MHSCYSCQILVKMEFSRQTFEGKNSNIKFSGNLLCEAQLCHADRRADRQDEANNRSSLLFKRAQKITLHQKGRVSQIEFGVLPKIHFIAFQAFSQSCEQRPKALSCTAVCPYVRMQQFGPRWTSFREMAYCFIINGILFYNKQHTVL